MNWADEVELSERLQETLEERESEDNTYSLTNSNVSPTGTASMPTSLNTQHKDRRRRRKRSTSRDRFRADDRRRSSVEIGDSGTSRSRRNSENMRSRKNSEDDGRSWRADSQRVYSKNNSRSNSRNNSRNNSLERDYQNFTGCERRMAGNPTERIRRNSAKSSQPPRRRGSRDHSWDRQREKVEQPKQEENWREEARRLNGPGPFVDGKKQLTPAGILIIPQSTSPHKEMETGNKSFRNNSGCHMQRQLFDPNNPQRPVIVNAPSDGARMAGYPPHKAGQQMMSPDGQFAVPMAQPAPVLQNPHLLHEAEVIDFELNHILMSSSWYDYREDITKRRARLQEILWLLLTTDIKFCEQENIEMYFWKILYYNLLELLRKQMSMSPQNKEQIMTNLLNINDGLILVK